jgi:hypothetical protein
MRNLPKFVCFALALTLAAVAAPAARAQPSGELARKCRALMVKAYPTVLFGPTGNAAAQRAYFAECLKRQGNMPEAAAGPPPAETTGKGK